MKQSVTYKPLSNEEYKKVANKKMYLSWLTLMTGARIAEVHRIINQYISGDKHIDIQTKKSGTGTNRIYLNKEAIKLLNSIYRVEFKGLTVRTLQRRIENEALRVDLKYSSHNLRATFATRLIQNGVDIVTIQHLMNHSDVSITARYIQFDENKLRTGLNTLVSLDTMEGKTNQELLEEIQRLRSQLRRLEIAKNEQL